MAATPTGARCATALDAPGPGRLLALALLATACSRGDAAGPVQATPEPADPAATDPALRMVGYDMRRLRPRDDEPLATMFERMRVRAS